MAVRVTRLDPVELPPEGGDGDNDDNDRSLVLWSKVEEDEEQSLALELASVDIINEQWSSGSTDEEEDLPADDGDQMENGESPD